MYTYTHCEAVPRRGARPLHRHLNTHHVYGLVWSGRPASRQSVKGLRKWYGARPLHRHLQTLHVLDSGMVQHATVQRAP
jgi:hypothetical protein